MKPERVSVIGYGRFGQLFASILKYDFDVKIADINPALGKKAHEHGLHFVSEEEALQSDVVFYCLPISRFESTLTDHVKIFFANKRFPIVADTLSVKVYPKKIFRDLLPPDCQAFLTHPMFGPDSVAVQGLAAPVDRRRSVSTLD